MQVTVHLNITLIEGVGDQADIVKRVVEQTLKEAHDHKVFCEEHKTLERVRWEPSLVKVTVDGEQ